MTQSLFYFFYLICFFYQNNIFSHEYLYPIGSIIQDGIEKICVIHQKNMHLTAWFWNPSTGIAVKGLSSPYNAAGISILPSQEEFSFLQNDVIKLKNINKKSSRMLDLYGPYDFNTIKWLSNETCYFSAKYLKKMRLFQANKENNVLCLTNIKSTFDYMYPQQKGEFLFYIKRNEEGVYSVCKIPYKYPFMENEEDAFLKKGYLEMERENVLYVHENKNEHLGFLFLNNDFEGFFISYLYEKNNSFVTFKVFSFSTDTKNSIASYLFSFLLPLFLIKEESNKESLRLYESIVPLLPKYYKDCFYYSNGNREISLYSYNKNQQKVSLISPYITYDSPIYFSPYCFNNVLYYGGVISINGPIQLIYDDNNNDYYIKLPHQSI